MAVVTVDLVVEEVGVPGRHRAVLSYDSADPYAVEIAFVNMIDPVTGQSPLTWTFDRHLLAHGLVSASGEGDVTVGPGNEPDWLLLGLSGDGNGVSPDRAVLRLPRHWVAYFLRRTYRLVPLGAERVDIESLITDCLAGGAP